MPVAFSGGLTDAYADHTNQTVDTDLDIFTRQNWDCGDYIGLAYCKGFFYGVWVDNSNSTGDNPGDPPNGTPSMDIYVSKPAY